MQNPQKRSFLFLQTIASPFFRKLGQKLSSQGYNVQKINFNGGDWFYWHGLNETNFSAPPEDFEDFLKTFVAKEGFTDFVLFGDCRPWHIKAIQLANILNIQVWVFEEGYLRPNWIVLENEGVNANSSFQFNHTQQSLIKSDFRPLTGGFKQRVTFDFIYNFFNILLKWQYPHHKTHRPYPILVEYASWARRLIRLSWERRQAKTAIQSYSHFKNPIYLFPLQLDSDFQVRHHSRFSGMLEAIKYVLEEFQHKAPNNTLLLVKNHPLDNGLINYRKHIKKIAKKLGVQERVTFVDGGDLNKILSYVQGVITINSTVGIAAIEMQLPVALLGEAIYDWDQLVYKGSSIEFWTKPQTVDLSRVQEFKEQLHKKCHINGNYYTEQGMEIGTENSFHRMIESSGLELTYD